MSIFEDFEGAVVSINIKFPTKSEVREAAKAVLFLLDGDTELGAQPGGFTSSLIQLACHADQDNLAKLSLGFGAIVTAVDMYKNEAGGVETLRHLASDTPDAQPGAGFSPKGN